MTTEQKAKAYDKAIERANKLQKTCDSTAVIGWCEYIFPELKEPEDDKIRKELIGYFTGWSDKHLFRGFKAEQILAWLEKQENKDSQVILPNILWHNGSEEPEEQCEILCEWESKDAVWHDIAFYHADTKTFWNGGEKIEYVSRWIYVNEMLEKQGEQKSDDKVKPKFKVGDWCIDVKDDTIFQIVKVLDNTYTYKTNKGKEYSCTHYSLENDARLWTIQDAKDGDVLAAHECLVLFREIDGLNIRCYCTYHFMNNPSFYVNTLQNKDTFHPATKEQCAILEKAMADAGYTFDFDKKELKKIEQTSAWSEVDEYTLGETIQHLEELIRIEKVKHCGIDVQYYQRDIDWLKSLKDKYTWKPSDEQMKALNAINVTGGISYVGQGQELINLFNDLKRLLKI